MGGPIPWTAIREYATWLGLDDEDLERMVFLLREMDDEREKFMKEKSNNGG